MLTRSRRKTRGALVVGVADNQTERLKLRGPGNDTRNFTRAMRDHYRNVGFLTLENATATRKNILDSIPFLFDFNVGFIYFSGHGSQIYDQNEPDRCAEVLIPFDHTWDFPLLDVHVYERLARRPRGQRIYLIFDCCHAEGQGSPRGDIEAIERYCDPPGELAFSIPGIRATMKNLVYFSACRSNQSSWEQWIDGQVQGVFTWGFCRVLGQRRVISNSAFQKAIVKEIAKFSPQNPIIEPCNSAIFGV